jgi:hypothetical protein
MLAMALVLPSVPSSAQEVTITATVAPPAIPVYEQPPVPGPGYLWTPGYWAYADADYYWVPGTWVQPPKVGVLWTPGYWGWSGGTYAWNGGYWGESVGFYGGINYGFGYGGVGFGGGHWKDGAFAYNRSVTNVTDTKITNVYNEEVHVARPIGVSFNGGQGGIEVKATAAEEAVAHGQHVAATEEQIKHEHTASTTPTQRAKANGGHPTVAASPKPGALTGQGVVPAKGAAATHPAEPNKAEPNKAEPAAHPAGSNAAHPAEPNKAEPNKAEPAAHPTGSNAAHPAEPNKPEPAAHPTESHPPAAGGHPQGRTE